MTTVSSSEIIWSTLSHVACSLGLALFPPSSRGRLASFALVCVCVFQAVAVTSRHYTHGVVLTMYLIGSFLQFSSCLVIRPQLVSPDRMLEACIQDGISRTFSPRAELRSDVIPRFRRADPVYVPSRGTFLRQRVWTVAWTVAAYHLVSTYRLNILVSDFLPPHDRLISRFSDVTLREIVIRFNFMTLQLLRPYLLITAGHAAASVFAVSVLGQQPKQWPPLWGKLADAYTLRRLYKFWWHGLTKMPLVLHARWLVEDVAGIRIGSRNSVGRTVTTMVVFGLSGLMHTISGTSSWDCINWGASKFLLAFGAGVCVEDLAMRFASKARVVLFAKRNRSAAIASLENAIGRSVGYGWVIISHMWMGPNTLYPNIVCRAQSAMKAADLIKKNEG